jgi:thiol-disulfide isomerase/thioredoxin
MKKEHFLSRLNVLRKEASASFNYDQVPDEFDQADSIPIECLTHGVFYQKPIRHVYGGKCPSCVKDYKRSLLVDRNSITTEDFISKSRLKFKDRFNYSKTIYKSKYELITLTCSRHGDIEIPAFQHFRYNFGCPKCSKEIPLIKKTEKRLEKARKIHNNSYNYSRVVPCTDTNKVEIVCPKHGSFFQYLYDHSVKGIGCPDCSIENGKLTLEEFKTRSNELFKHQYTYEKVSFKEVSNHVIITCKQHGDFKQRVASHLAAMEYNLNTL